MHIVTREELYERVWADPLSVLAEQLSTNGPWLKKLCLEAGIPLPAVGHWSKLRAGKLVVVTPLPPRPPGASAVITVGDYGTCWRYKSELLRDPLPVRPEFPESVEEVAARAAARLKLALGARRSRAGGHVNRRRFLDELRAALSELEAELCITRQEPPELIVRVGAVNVPFKLAAIAPDAPDRLCLDLPTGEQGRFEDEEGKPLEVQLPEIIAAIMTIAERKYRAEAMAHYQWCLERRADAEADARLRTAQVKRLLERRRIERKERRRQRLLSQAHAWRTAQDIRGFVADILQQADTKPAKHALASWAAWALHEADAMDPVKQGDLLPYDLSTRKK